MPARKFLIVDDSEDDRFFLERELTKALPRCSIVGIVRDGEAAVEYLNGAGPFANRALFPLPDVMLLDLKMPRMNGFDVLRWLRLQNLKELMVIVVSTSFLREDIQTAKALGAHDYVVKELPLDTAAAIAQIVRKRYKVEIPEPV
ncbi:MAG TPA: response regulator [Verrucomicrobiae bacterium]|nr:response regulator [Verrucomicrobiae bacterium]